MKVAFTPYRLENPPPPEVGAALAGLVERLGQLGFTEEGVRDLLRPPRTPCSPSQELVGHLWRCRREGSRRARLVELWLLCQALPRRDVTEWLGAESAERLLAYGVLVACGGGQVAAAADLYPCRGRLFLSDRMIGTTRRADRVYPPGKDSYALARLTPPQRAGSALDLGTGSGIQAVLAAGHTDTVTGVDLNLRALAFARFNAALNGVGQRCRFVPGNLYAGVGEQQYDLVLANPPWVPAPGPDLEWYRGGGESGEQVVRGVLAGLHRHLAVGGTAAIFSVYPVRADSYLDRVAAWLEGGPWGLALAHLERVEREDFVRDQVGARETPAGFAAEYGRWMEAYDRAGIEAIGSAVIFVRRLPPGAAGWAVERFVGMPDRFSGEWAGRWLDRLEACRQAGWRPRRVPGVRLWRGPGGAGRAEFSDPPWLAPVELSPDELVSAERLEGPPERLWGLVARGVVQ